MSQYPHSCPLENITWPSSAGRPLAVVSAWIPWMSIHRACTYPVRKIGTSTSALAQYADSGM